MPKISNKKSDKVFERHPGYDEDVDRTDEIDVNSKIAAYENARNSGKSKTDRMSKLKADQNKDFVRQYADAVNQGLKDAGYNERSGMGSKNGGTKTKTSKYDLIGASNPPNGPKKKY